MSVSVLVIDDDEEDFLIIQHYLSKIKTADYKVAWYSNFEGAAAEILKGTQDIYLVDYFLGKGEGIDIIEEVRKKDFLKPILLLTGAGNRDLDEKALVKGASDFLDKNELRADTVERALRYAIERYNQQQNIRNQEQKYRSLFELNIEPFLILDEDLKILEFNAEFTEIFGQPINYEINADLPDFGNLFKSAEDFTLFKQQLSSNGFIKGFKTVLQNGSRDIVSALSIAGLPQTKQAKQGAYHVAISDLTKIMEQESELKKMDKLMMSGRMARMIAHEVRNPLTNIRLAVEELSELYADNEDAKSLQEMIERNSLRIANLIEDLLKSARPMELEKKNTNLAEIVTAAIDFCGDRIKLLNVELKKRFSNTVLMGNWDAEKLKIALVNIIINAIEAMEGVSSPQLSVYLNEEPDAYIIYIRDNGKGMDRETLSNLYEPLFTGRQGGMGLGMTATLNIISMHEGKINVQSEEGKGTEFMVSLPKSIT